jgi:WD40 repeat protein
LREFKFGDSIDDQQVACLWQNLHLLTVSLSGQINYLDANPGSSETVLRSIKGHNKSVTALETIKKADASAFVISGSHDGVIVCWNSSNGQMNVIKASNGSSVGQHKNQVQALRYDASTGLVISCGLDDTLKYIDINEYTYV